MFRLNRMLLFMRGSSLQPFVSVGRLRPEPGSIDELVGAWKEIAMPKLKRKFTDPQQAAKKFEEVLAANACCLPIGFSYQLRLREADALPILPRVFCRRVVIWFGMATLNSGQTEAAEIDDNRPQVCCRLRKS